MMVKYHLAKMVISTLITIKNGGQTNVYTDSLSKENPVESHFFKERNDGFGGRRYLLNEFLEDEPILVLMWLTWAGHF